jgi:hypothetical protein
MPAWMNISPLKLENCPVLPEKITWIGWRSNKLIAVEKLVQTSIRVRTYFPFIVQG